MSDTDHKPLMGNKQSTCVRGEVLSHLCQLWERNGALHMYGTGAALSSGLLLCWLMPNVLAWQAGIPYVCLSPEPGCRVGYSCTVRFARRQSVILLACSVGCDSQGMHAVWASDSFDG